MRSCAKLPAADPPHQPSPTYAKLTRPRLCAPLARTRLFALLDGLRLVHRVIWIGSPPGAGKSTLAATWLAENGVPAIWYQVDQADADPGTLFFYLGEALRGMDGAMNWRAPDVKGDPSRFARIFFRTLYAGLPAGAVVVLDNLHEFDWAHAGQLLESAFSEVPDGVTVLAISREAPPARLARLELSGTLALLGWDQLRADRDEARAMAQLNGQCGPVTEQWLDLADGWAAAVAMLRGADADDATPLLNGRETVFRYFAGEVLERMAPADQHALLLMACVPAFPADQAQVLTGGPAAPRLLERLYRDRLFVERRASLGFHFHPLFGEFLRRLAHQRIEAGELAAFVARAAAMLEADGRMDEAAGLYQEAGDRDALKQFLLRSASGMIADGRGECWRIWLSWLDASVTESEPNLSYWHGLSLVEVRPQYARGLLTRAESAFARSGEQVARLLSVGAIIDSYETEWSDTSALAHWNTVLGDGLRSAGLPPLDPDTELKLHSRLAAALLAVAPESALLAGCVERVLLVMRQVEQPAALLAAGAILLRYFDGQGSAARANALITQLNRVTDAPAASMVGWHRHVARWYHKEGEPQQAQQAMMAARRLAGDHRLDPLLLQTLEARHLLDSGALPPARVLLDQIGATLSVARGRELVEWSLLDTHWHTLSGDMAGALAGARATVRFGFEAGMPASERAGYDALLGACLAWSEDYAGAARCYATAAHMAVGVQLALLRDESVFIDACAKAQLGDADGAGAALRQAMDAQRQRRATALFPMIPALASRVVALALEYRIESEHAAMIAARQQLVAPHRSVPGWPWPVAIRTLGKLEIMLDGVALASSGKTQQRPLTLLKSLVAAGETGRTQQALVTQLWGNADVARSALNVTLHRLRKILRSDDVIVVAGGRICLNESKVWSDVSALDALCADIGGLAPAPAAETVARLAAALLELYRGPFCDGIDDSWILPLRDRSRNVFLAAVARLGQELESDQQWPLALGLYQRALEAEPLSEANYRGWMRCAHAKDGTAAAFGAYRRCRETLSIVLGVAPASDTEKLAVTLGLKQPAN